MRHAALLKAASDIFGGEYHIRGEEVLPAHADETRASSWGSSSAHYSTPEFTAAFAEIGIAFTRGGAEGEFSDQTFARLGSRPAMLRFPGDEVPGRGAVAVTVENWSAAAQVQNFRLLTYTGTCAGIAGTLAWDAAAGALRWTRTSGGSAVALSGAVPMIPDVGNRMRNAIVLLWAGKNNIVNLEDPAISVGQTVEAVQWLSPLYARCLVLGHYCNGDAPAWAIAVIKRANALMARQFGSLFVDVQGWLMSRKLWTHVGLSPTRDDLAAQAADRLPPSLWRTPADPLHLADAADTALARRIVLPRLKKLWNIG